MFSLRHLAVFKAVSETGSFTGAAQELFITQSAVSHTIRELEEYTGAALFDRLSRQVRLTSCGRLLLEEAAPILASCESLEKRIGHLEMQATLRIVSSITIASFWLPRILKEVEKKAPDTPVYVQVVSASEAARVLQAGDADIALVEGVLPQGPFLYRRFDEYSLRILRAPDYPLPGRTVSIGQFCLEKLLLREPGSAIRDVLDSRLLLSGYTARPAWVSVNSTALLEAAKAGLGITVLPEVLTEHALAEGSLLSLMVDGLSLRNDLIAVWHKEKHMTGALEVFLSCIP